MKLKICQRYLLPEMGTVVEGHSMAVEGNFITNGGQYIWASSAIWGMNVIPITSH